jgi:hypothetical protein
VITPQTLTEIIAGLEPQERDALGGIHVTMDKGTAVARLSISLFGPIGFGRSGVSVDTANLPDGITVGGVDAARVGPGAGGYRWTIKTHAGSPTERAAWATRKARMGRPPLMADAQTWLITLPADLKTWALGNGGAKLVRELLERERADAA